jgi:hypothetical protein
MDQVSVLSRSLAMMARRAVMGGKRDDKCGVLASPYKHQFRRSRETGSGCGRCIGHENDGVDKYSPIEAGEGSMLYAEAVRFVVSVTEESTGNHEAETPIVLHIVD